MPFEQYRARLEKLSSTNIADALDTYGLKGATYGIRPIWEGASKIVGEAVTVKLIAAGLTKGKNHLGVKAIDAAKAGDVIVVDNGGRLDTSCWGGILANGAKMKGVNGVVIDGACRDVDDYVDIKFPVYSRGSVVATARGRIMEEATNIMIQFAGVQVRPGDIVFGDRSGVVVIPAEKLEEVLVKAEELYEKEEAMISEIRAGKSMLEVDNKYSYEKMLSK
ncbi:MAG TPA: RraA family protein [Clostridia bacterium]|nr:RraA family protein [Clostridia bacterium]